MEPRGRLPLLIAALLGACAPPATAEILLTTEEALARAFPGLTPERRTVYLKPEEVHAIEQAARSKLPSPVVTVYEARAEGALVGRAILDTHVVRTMPETILTVVGPEGRLKMALVLQFAEPPDYLPRDRWRDTLAGRALDDDLWPGRGVPRVTGATLTVQAMTEAVRRALALDQTVLRGKNGRP